MRVTDTVSAFTDHRVQHRVLSAGGVTDDEEAASPVPNVMDNSGALFSGVPDPGSRGVVKMPDSESLRRSMAAEQQRQAALAQGSPGPGPGVEAAPVSATSSGGLLSSLLLTSYRGLLVTGFVGVCTLQGLYKATFLIESC